MIVVPLHLGTIHLGEKQLEILNASNTKYLVIRDPYAYILTYYLHTNSPQKFKHWYRANPPPSQVSYLPDYDMALRAEYFANDLHMETGLVGTIKQSVLPNVSVCSATRADMTKRYLVDYEAGDYLNTF